MIYKILVSIYKLRLLKRPVCSQKRLVFAYIDHTVCLHMFAYIYHTDSFKSAIADVDECLEKSTNDCDINANCTNTEGSYNCTCNIGFHRDGKNCTGMECSLNFWRLAIKGG